MILDQFFKGQSGVNSWYAPALLDHAQDARANGEYEDFFASGKARLIKVDDKNLIEFSSHKVAAGTSYSSDCIFIGKIKDEYWFAKRDEIKTGVALRDAELSDAELQAATSAIAILNWWDRAKYCPECTGEIKPRHGGFEGECEACNKLHFPRTDPAVIVAILDEDERIYLAHNSMWKKNQVSILAGFVESGESAEQACFREVEEEAKLKINKLTFFGSQPWPFPRSLMLGFFARISNRDAAKAETDGTELEWGDFYTREEIIELAKSGKLILPTKASIASRMLKAWLEGQESIR